MEGKFEMGIPGGYLEDGVATLVKELVKLGDQRCVLGLVHSAIAAAPAPSMWTRTPKPPSPGESRKTYILKYICTNCVPGRQENSIRASPSLA